MLRRRLRSPKGQQIVEFAAALVLLVLLFFVPMLDLGIMPVRWFMSQELIGMYARRLSLCENLTQSYKILAADPSLETKLVKLGGVRPKNIQLNLLITSARDPREFTRVSCPRTIPREWLPNGTKAPCDYLLELTCELEISPAIMMQWDGPKIMGLNAPVPFVIQSTSPWENLGRNPVTKGFFVNE